MAVRRTFVVGALMIYVGNAFSLGMVPSDLLRNVRMEPCARPVLGGLEWTSCVGHADTATVLGVPFARSSVTLAAGDSLFVAQLQGGRLPEGARTLPDGASFAWVRVYIAA